MLWLKSFACTCAHQLVVCVLVQATSYQCCLVQHGYYRSHFGSRYLALALQQAFSATLAQAVVLQQVDYRDISMLRHV